MARVRLAWSFCRASASTSKANTLGSSGVISRKRLAVLHGHAGRVGLHRISANGAQDYFTPGRLGEAREESFQILDEDLGLPSADRNASFRALCSPAPGAACVAGLFSPGFAADWAARRGSGPPVSIRQKPRTRGKPISSHIRFLPSSHATLRQRRMNLI